jgi:predicted hydrocarbon binding protein
MDTTVDRFQGDLPGFLEHLRGQWGWIVEYDPKGGVILVNENKSKCVCPLTAGEPGADLGVLCYCSEGFAERMFSAVTGAAAHAEVTESILRGGERCRYRIEVRDRA